MLDITNIRKHDKRDLVAIHNKGMTWKEMSDLTGLSPTWFQKVASGRIVRCYVENIRTLRMLIHSPTTLEYTERYSRTYVMEEIEDSNCFYPICVTADLAATKQQLEWELQWL